MNKQQFEEKIRSEIHPGLYIEPTSQEDLDRIMVEWEGKPIYICAFPKGGVREEFDPAYQSIMGAPFRTREQTEAKVRHFIETLPDNIDLYE